MLLWKKTIAIGCIITSVLSIAWATPQHFISRFQTAKYATDFSACDFVNPDAPKGGTLRLGELGTFDALNPFVVKGIAPTHIWQVYDPLMIRVPDDPHALYGLIAEKAEVAEDFSHVTFYLNPRATFHDGHPITTEDIIFTIQLLSREGLPRYQHFYRNIIRIETLDKHTLRFYLRPQNGVYNQELPSILANIRPLPKHILENIDFKNCLQEPIIGSGAYQISPTSQMGRKLVLKRVPTYWAQSLPIMRGKNNFDTINIDYYRNAQSLLQAVRSGELDTHFEADVKEWAIGYNFPSIANGSVKKVELEHHRPVTVRMLLFNMRRPVFSDIRVRRALNLAFNMDRINKLYFDGALLRMDSMFANTPFASHRDIPTIQQELRRYQDHLPPEILSSYPQIEALLKQDLRTRMKEAHTLLQEAGWHIVDGRRVHQTTGTPLRFEFLYKDPRLEKLAQEFKQSLKQLGIELVLRFSDVTQYEKRTTTHDFDMIAHQISNSLSPGIEQTSYFNAALADEPATSNYGGVKNLAIEALAQNVATAPTPEALTEAVQIFDYAVMSMTYFIPATYDNKLRFVYRQNRVAFPPIHPSVGTNAMCWWWAISSSS